MSDLSKILKEEVLKMEMAMKLHNINKTDLLNRANININTWGLWRRGEGNPTFRKFERAKQVLAGMLKDAE